MTAADTFFQKGMQAYLARNFAKSTKWFTKALLENPENVNYYYYRGMSFQEMELYTEAIEDYTAALELYSGCVPIRYNRANIYRKLGYAERAAEDLTYVIIHANQTKEEGYWLVLAYLGRGLVKIDYGDLEQGFIDLEKAEALAKDQEEVALLSQIADELEKSGL
jgi:tetratricopeptide (TPR) repeat protein